MLPIRNSQACRTRRARPVGFGHRLGEVRRQGVPLLLVDGLFRGSRGHHQQLAGVLDVLAGFVGVEVHDVVRVDQADEQRPWFALVGHRPAGVAQPGLRGAADHRVSGIAAQVVRQ